ncbi:delta-60 repeat domain-containing protein [Desulfogranum japonicum]|uniref:delta-60 repeat domain-containing protein n=1 Tax=Desulfogranum japonicum TaxID=231447 RepID=UPI000418908A|nr:delta-60 repeat domain-containing protein [Desulfogranum japonicum]
MFRYAFATGLFLLVVLTSLVQAESALRLASDFGEDGILDTGVGVYGDRGHAMAVQADGKLVIAGSSSNAADNDFAVLRLLQDGSMDTSFNVTGQATTAVGRSDDEALAVTVLSDGRIVAAGYTMNEGNRDFALVCYQADGSLDTSFGDLGIVVTAIGSGHDELTAVTVDNEGRLVLAGIAEGTNGGVVVIGRFFEDGTPDTSFGDQGWSLVGVGDDAVAQGILVQENGRILVSGTYQEDDVTSLFLIGFLENGTVDESFAEKGVAIPTAVFEFSEGYGLAKGAGNEIFVAAAVGVDQQRDAALFEFSESGVPGVYFDGEQYLIAHAGEGDDALYDVKVLASGTLVASGFTTEDERKKFLLISYGEQEAEFTSSSHEINESSSTQVTKPVKVSELQVVEDGSPYAIPDIQVRSLKMESSLESFLQSSESAAVPYTVSPYTIDVLGIERKHLSFGEVCNKLLTMLGNFFVAPAAAEESSGKTVTATVIDVGDGDSVSYSIGVVDGEDVVVVGTSSDDSTDTVSVAKVTSGSSADAATSSSIVTTQVTDINRTGALSGGTITSGLSGVTQRGVVFSIDPYPIYSDASGDDGDDDTPTTFTATITNPNSSTITTTTPTLEVTTSDTATCKYSKGSDPGYSSMTTFSSTSSTSHSQALSTPVSENPYTYYVRCQNSDGDEASDSVSFTVSTSKNASAQVLQDVLQKMGSFLVGDALAADDDSSDDSSGGIFSGVNSSDKRFDEEGHTDDGSGIGIYTSRLTNLKPSTIYYVRAYAMVGSSVYYGQQYSFKTADACFIATASYGSLLHPCVQVLRDFRDQYLLTNGLGKAFVDQYYSHSPSIAAYIEQHGWARVAVKVLLLPLIAFSWLAVHCGLYPALVISAALTGSVMMYLRKRRHLAAV